MSNEAFEKWFVVSKYNDEYYQIAKEAWQAAKADSESILQEQQNTIAELEIDYNMLFSDFLELQAKNSELSASINDLREALEENHYCNSSEKAINLYNAAISKTPAQSLQEHNNKIKEVKCKTHPDAPHGFNRNESHSAGRYVCDCEFWENLQSEVDENGI